MDDAALQAAVQADLESTFGIDRGPLHGIPFGVKDVFATKDVPTTCQSIVFDRNWGSGRDAPAVARVRTAARSSWARRPRWSSPSACPTRTSRFLCPGTPGTLTAGRADRARVPQAAWPPECSSPDSAPTMVVDPDPAAFCGTSGLMPTFGRVPKSGCADLAYSLDHVGPLALSASGLRGRAAGECRIRRLRYQLLDPPRAGLLRRTQRVARRCHRRRGASRPLPRRRRSRLSPAVRRGGGSSGGARGTSRPGDPAVLLRDGVGGHLTMSAEAAAYHLPDLRIRWSDYFEATRLNVTQGVLTSAADYVQAQRVRRVVQGKLAQLFEEVDLVVSPATATPSPRYEDLGPELDPMPDVYFTTYWNAVGNPALVVPMDPAQTACLCPYRSPDARSKRGCCYVPEMRTSASPTGTCKFRRSPRRIQSIARSPVERVIDELMIPGRQSRRPLTKLTGPRCNSWSPAAGLAPSDEEVGVLSNAYLMLRAAIEALYKVPEARNEAPGLVFDAAPGFDDWGLTPQPAPAVSSQTGE